MDETRASLQRLTGIVGLLPVTPEKREVLMWEVGRLERAVRAAVRCVCAPGTELMGCPLVECPRKGSPIRGAAHPVSPTNRNADVEGEA